MSRKRLLVADSCIGGLSVVPSIADTNREDVELVFLADYAVNPLGTKSPGEISSVIDRWMRVAATTGGELIIACNTLSIRYQQVRGDTEPATSVSSMLDYTEALIRAKRDDIDGRNVVVLGTAFTAAQPVYADMLHRIARPESVTGFAATGLERRVARLEDGPLFVDPGIEGALESADVVLLSCTCFPLIQAELEAAFPGTRFLAPGSEATQTQSTKTLQLIVTGDVVQHSDVLQFARETLGEAWQISLRSATDLDLH